MTGCTFDTHNATGSAVVYYHLLTSHRRGEKVNVSWFLVMVMSHGGFSRETPPIADDTPFDGCWYVILWVDIREKTAWNNMTSLLMHVCVFSFLNLGVKTNHFLQQWTTVLTRTLCLRHPHVSVKKYTGTTVTGWLSAVGICQNTQWASLLSDVKTLRPPLFVERSWKKERDSSCWVQRCQSRRWDKSLHSYTDLTVSTVHMSLYRWFTDKIRYKRQISQIL